MVTLMKSATSTCIICHMPYIAAKATAERRGFCTRTCEKVLEKKHGLYKQEVTHTARWAFQAEHSALLRSTPGADSPRTTAPEAKALLTRLLEEAGVEAFFHDDLEHQERAVKAASLREILERAFNPFDDDMRAALLAEAIAIAVDQAHRGDAVGLRRALAAIHRTGRTMADETIAAELAI
jgi:hypothetical protein